MRRVVFLLTMIAMLMPMVANAGFLLGEEGERSLYIGGMMHPTFTYDLEAEDDEPALHFKLRMTRLFIKGNVTPNVTYFIHSKFETGGYTLLHCWVNWKANDMFSIKAGQMFSPFGRVFAVSGAKLMFMNRTPLTAMSPKFQLGIAPTVSLLDKKLDISAGIFNGKGLNGNGNAGNTDDNIMMTAKLNFAPFGNVPGDESAHMGYDELKLLVVPGFSMNSVQTVVGVDTLGNPTYDDLTTTTYGGHLCMRYNYLAFDGAMYMAGAELDTVETSSMGFSFQAGYAVGGKFEPIVRYSMLDSDTEVDDNETTTIEAGLNYYIKGYSSRLGLNYISNTTKVPGGDDIKANTINLYYEIIY